MARTLLLLRHAKAEPWDPGMDDFRRELSSRGERDMRRLATWMGAHLTPPSRVLCSPSVRTVATLEPIVTLWPELERRIDYPDNLYGATAGTLLDLAGEALEQFDSVLMVGHNPAFESLAFYLMPPEDASGRHKLPTGLLAVFEFPGAFGPHAESVILRHWVRGKELSGD